MREDYLIAMANLVNGSLLGYEDRSRVPEYEKKVDDYVDSLEQENQKYKEVIDKAIEKLYCWGEALNPEFQKIMLDILKEVE